MLLFIRSFLFFDPTGFELASSSINLSKFEGIFFVDFVEALERNAPTNAVDHLDVGEFFLLLLGGSSRRQLFAHILLLTLTVEAPKRFVQLSTTRERHRWCFLVVRGQTRQIDDEQEDDAPQDHWKRSADDESSVCVFVNTFSTMRFALAWTANGPMRIHSWDRRTTLRAWQDHIVE